MQSWGGHGLRCPVVEVWLLVGLVAHGWQLGAHGLVIWMRFLGHPIVEVQLLWFIFPFVGAWSHGGSVAGLFV